MKQIKKIKKTTIKCNNNQHQINQIRIQIKISKITNSIIESPLRLPNKMIFKINSRLNKIICSKKNYKSKVLSCLVLIIKRNIFNLIFKLMIISSKPKIIQKQLNYQQNKLIYKLMPKRAISRKKVKNW
jgi:hypothetical protein